MADLLEEGRILFNSGQYYEAHEVWEDLWRATGSPLKTCYQGLIQAAVGLHHLGQGNVVGARSQLGKSMRNLGGGLSLDTGLDIGSLIQDLQQLLAEIGVAEADRAASLKPLLLARKD